ncbi:hypothetical protein AGOR_G00230690 [Albula goreensis]|uniref:Uncharacterized protein n=1 Tax=Albula goreensis TaxID=1534307 RepID=A0A8T3CHG8_9TELE|nr:hypothetical protein AGOR_G00230690 [Albula goreensis]
MGLELNLQTLQHPPVMGSGEEMKASPANRQRKADPPRDCRETLRRGMRPEDGAAQCESHRLMSNAGT